MKKLNKNILFGLGAISAVVAPVATLVACGNSNSTDINKNVKQTNGSTSSANSNTPVALTVRPIADLLSAAFTASSNTIDLAKVNNQFELASLLAEVSGFNKMSGISSGFDKTNVEKDRPALKQLWTNAKTKVDALLAAHPTDKDINIQMGNKTFVLNFKATALFQSMSAGADQPETALTAATGDGLLFEGLAGISIAKDLGTELFVSTLVEVNETFAMGNLMKMTHLPAQSFNSFKELVQHMETAFFELTNSDVFLTWVKDNKISMANKPSGIEYTTSALIDAKINGEPTMPGLIKNYPTLTHEQFVNMFLGGHFITVALS